MKKEKKTNNLENLSAEEILKEVERYDKNKKEFKKQPLGRFKITKEELDSIKFVEEKKLKELEKKKREEKRILEKKLELKKKNKKLNKLKLKTKKRFLKIKNKSFSDKEDLNFIKELFLTSVISGLILNYICLVIFNSKFLWWGFPAYGFVYFLFLKIIPSWTRNFWERKIN